MAVGVFSYIISYIFSLILFPITLLSSWLVVRPFQEVVILLYGQYRTTVKTPGLYFYCYFGHTIRRISTKLTSLDLPDMNITDLNGSPLIANGVVTFRVKDSYKSALSVGEAVSQFVLQQAEVVLKMVCARHPYEDMERKAPSLRVDDEGVITSELVAALQERVDTAGIKVIAFELADLKFAPDIAQLMLARQEAQAMLGAKKYVVDGATSIATHAVQMLEEAGIEINELDSTNLMGNLILLLVGNTAIHPVISLSQPPM